MVSFFTDPKGKKEIRPELLMELIDRLNSVSNNYHKILKEMEIFKLIIDN